MIDGKQIAWRAICPAMPKAPKDPTDLVVAARVVRLRRVLGYATSSGFAAFLGVSDSRWNNVENGSPLSNDMAGLLVRKVPGLSRDWLYDGRPDGLTFSLARSLGEFGDPDPGKTSTR